MSTSLRQQSASVKNDSKTEEHNGTEPAGFTLRFFAMLFDSVVMYYIVCLVLWALGAKKGIFVHFFVGIADTLYRNFDGGVILGHFVPLVPYLTFAIMWFLLTYFIGLFYGTFCESSLFQGTPGKLLMTVKVTTEDSEPVGLLKAGVRSFLKFFSALPLGGGYLLCLFTYDKRTVHDFLSGCYLVRPLEGRLQQATLGALFSSLAFSVTFFGVILPSNIDYAALMAWDPSPWVSVSEAELYHRYDFFHRKNAELFDGITPEVRSTVIKTKRKKKKSVISTVPFSELNSPSPSPTPTQLVVDVGLPLPLPLPEMMHLTVGESMLRLADSFVRLESNENSSERALSTGREQETLLRIAFFEKALSPKQEKQLEYVPNFLEYAENQIGQPAIAEIVFMVNTSQRGCSPRTFLKGSMQYRLPGKENIQKVDLDPSKFVGVTPYARDGHFQPFCEALEIGQEFSLTYQEKRSSTDLLSLQWSVKLTEPIHRFRLFSKIDYRTFETTLALWNPNKEELQVGFFRTGLTGAEIKQILRSKSLLDPNHPLPELIATVPLWAQTKRVDRESARKGYSLEIFDRPGGSVKLPGSKKSLTFSVEAGKYPQTLSGELLPGKRIRGNFEGSWQRYSPGEGVISFRCETPFNAPVIVVN